MQISRTIANIELQGRISGKIRSWAEVNLRDEMQDLGAAHIVEAMPKAEASLRNLATVAGSHVHGSTHFNLRQLRPTGYDHHAPNPAPVNPAHLAAPFHRGRPRRHPQPRFGHTACCVDMARQQASRNEDLVNGYRPAGHPCMQHSGLEGFHSSEQRANRHAQFSPVKSVSAHAPGSVGPRWWMNPTHKKETKYFHSNRTSLKRISTSEFRSILTEPKAAKS